jgi:hypothetical protein
MKVFCVADGTVLVISPGHDMGQGIATKAKQAINPVFKVVLARENCCHC